MAERSLKKHLKKIILLLTVVIRDVIIVERLKEGEEKDLSKLNKT